MRSLSRRHPLVMAIRGDGRAEPEFNYSHCKRPARTRNPRHTRLRFSEGRTAQVMLVCLPQERRRLLDYLQIRTGIILIDLNLV